MLPKLKSLIDDKKSIELYCLKKFIKIILDIKASDTKKYELIKEELDRKIKLKNKRSNKFYKKNRTKHIESVNKHYRESGNKQWSYSFRGLVCEVTGTKFDGKNNLEWAHIDPSTKEYTIALMYHQKDFQTNPFYLIEIDKCKLVTRSVHLCYDRTWGMKFGFPQNEHSFEIFAECYRGWKSSNVKSFSKFLGDQLKKGRLTRTMALTLS